MTFLFQNCIEQPFDTQFVGVARNNEFAEEFLYNIKIIHQSLDARMSMYIVKIKNNSLFRNAILHCFAVLGSLNVLKIK